MLDDCSHPVVGTYIPVSFRVANHPFSRTPTLANAAALKLRRLSPFSPL